MKLFKGRQKENLWLIKLVEWEKDDDGHIFIKENNIIQLIAVNNEIGEKIVDLLRSSVKETF